MIVRFLWAALLCRRRGVLSAMAWTVALSAPLTVASGASAAFVGGCVEVAGHVLTLSPRM